MYDTRNLNKKLWKLVKAASFCSAYYKPVGKKNMKIMITD